jgi:DNA invertase Pin-like site-specific DNA recombinase
MSDRIQQTSEELEGLMIRQMNKGVPGPYLPAQFESLEAYMVAKIAATRAKRSAAKQGEKSRTARLTEAQVIEIRQKYLPGLYGSKKLAKEYGVSPSAIQGIISGITWTHVPMGDYSSPEEYAAAKKAEAAARPTTHTNAKLDKSKVREIRQRYSEGATKSALAREYGVHLKTVWDILQGNIWKDA